MTVKRFPAVTAPGYNASVTFTTSDAAWTIPTNLAHNVMRVIVVGGGGGGNGDPSLQAGGAGGTSSIVASGINVTAAGGAGARSGGGDGTAGTAGLSASNGGGNSTNLVSAATLVTAGGFGGKITIAYIDVTGLSTLAVTVASGGNGAGNATYKGGNGGRGEVIIEYQTK